MISIVPVNFVLTAPGITYTWTDEDGTVLAETGAELTVSEVGSYTVVVSNGVCASAPQTATFSQTEKPAVDTRQPEVACGFYELPPVTNGQYYSGPLGTGINYGVGEQINTTRTVYIYNAVPGNPDCYSQSEFLVTINPVPVADFTYSRLVVCEGDALILPPVGPQAGEFQVTSANAQNLSIDANGVINVAQSEPDTYIIRNVIAAANGCPEVISQDVTFIIEERPVVAARADENVCNSYTLPDDLQPGQAYYTQSGGQGQVLTPGTVLTQSQPVWVYQGNAGCFAEVMFNVNITSAAGGVTITEDCIDNRYTLTATFDTESNYSQDQVSFQWKDTSGAVVGTGLSQVIQAPGVYTLTVTPLSGVLSCPSDIEINVVSTSCMVQKGISPNGDGLNDSFDLSTLDVRQLSIYNRYGTEVYRFGNYTNQWQGQGSNGDELPTGTYFYMIERRGGEQLTGWIYVNREE